MKIQININTPASTEKSRDHLQSTREDIKISSPKSAPPNEKKNDLFRGEILDKDKMKEARERVQEEMERLKKVVHIFDRRYNFLLHESTNRIFVQIIDVTTDTIIREIPPEELLNLMAKIHTMVGLLFDERI